MRGRLTPPTLEGVLMVGFLTVALIGAVVGLSIWLTNKSDSAEAAAETQPAETQPAETQPAETAPTETEPATTAETEPAETEGETEEAETEAETEGGAAGEGDPAAGEAVWNSAGCASCHTLAAAGSTGTVGPNLDDAQPSHELVVERVTNGAGAMPAFGQQGILTEQQIQDVAAYVVQSTSG